MLSPARAADDDRPIPPRSATAQQVLDQLSVPATRQQATQALKEVQDLFSPMSRREARAKLSSGEGKDATMALRDLSLRLSSLSATDRSSAYEEFQRPWRDGAFHVQCRDNICVHWISPSEVGNSEVLRENATADSWATTTLNTLVDVSRAYRQAGYRTPRADAPRPDGQPYFGGSAATDIYLRDVGDEGKYGYCTVDVNSSGYYVFKPSIPGRSSDLPAFCVLDNDYLNPGFGARSPLQNLQVTAAHEYFHAVQFAYDYLEDRWFMEATATWAEDNLGPVYDAINDNVQYLRSSQLRYPGVSLDTFNGANGFLHYGDWLYFEYLTERLPARQGRLPVLVRRMWQYADSLGVDLYSTKAIAAALRERHVPFNWMFGQYAAANRHPATAYAEGRANHYPPGRARKTVRLKPGHPSTSGSYEVDHLASAAVRMIPRRLPKKSTRLTLKVNMANKRSGSVAMVVVTFKDGRVVTRSMKLNRKGDGRIRTAFSSRKVAAVDIVLVNASHSYTRCWHNTPYSCSGTPRNDDRTERFSAKVS